jgi:hypothetical protein
MGTGSGIANLVGKAFRGAAAAPRSAELQQIDITSNMAIMGAGAILETGGGSYEVWRV